MAHSSTKTSDITNRIRLGAQNQTSFRRDRVVPGISRRDEFGLDLDRCALLVVDIQRYLCPSVVVNDDKFPSDDRTDERASVAISHHQVDADERNSTIDSAQNHPSSHREGGRPLSRDGSPSMTYYSTYYQERFPNVLSNIVTLLDTFRSIRDGDEGDPDAGPELQVAAAASGTNPLCCPPPPPPPASSTAKCEVIFTYLQSMTNDGRDISLDYKLSGPLLAGIPRSHVRGSSRQENDDNDALFLPDCRPSPAGRGDLRLPKTSCNVFASTNLDYLLRQLGVDTVVLAGQMTEQCVESAVRHAADLGYFAVVVSDACIAASQEAHDSSLRRMNGFARIVHTTAELVSEIRELAGSCKEHSKPTTREDRYQQVAK